MVILNLLRVKHWIKNLIILLPLLFTFSFTNLNYIKTAFVGTLAFCLCASAVYILNDIFDIKNDRLHPVKKNRPIASGQIKIPVAIIIMFFLVILACILSYKIGIATFCTIIFYLIFNILYSLFFKKVIMLDVFCIAVFFILRLTIGCFAINMIPTEYMILVTLSLSLLLGFSKRYLELKYSENNASREVLKYYNIDILRQFLVCSAILTIVFYTMYTTSYDVINKFHLNYLYISVLPATYFILRILFLINNSTISDAVEFFFKDLQIKISLLILLLSLGFVILINNFLLTLS